ncbi:MAG: hypothetical protein M8352_06850 [ANME-2 cluster archaeon]|nr:hypothetical protein [ANME-2 cluster archaeon]MDF1531599.1 hypothetical protein [ANME-2 cluster archaeon]
MLRKNVSISNNHLKIIDPILKKNNGNLSATIRDIIDFTGFIVKKFGSIENAKEELSKENHSHDYYVDSIYGITMPLSMFRWLLESRDKSNLPIIEEVTQLFMPESGGATDLESVIKDINEKNSLLKWPLYIKTHIEGEKYIILISGSDTLINKFGAMLLSMYLANLDEPLKLTNVLKLPSSIQLQFITSKKSDAKEAFERFYGKMADLPVKS